MDKGRGEIRHSFGGGFSFCQDDREKKGIFAICLNSFCPGLLLQAVKMIFFAPCMKKLSQCMVFFSSFCSFTLTRIMGSVVGELQITYTIYSQDSCLKNCLLAVDVKYLALSNTQKTVYSLFIFATNWKVLNPLSPNIHKEIPQTDLYTFPYGISWEKLIKDQRFFSLWSFD